MAYNYDDDAKVTFTARLMDYNTVTKNKEIGKVSKDFRQILRENAVPNNGIIEHVLNVTNYKKSDRRRQHKKKNVELNLRFQILRDSQVSAMFTR